jgi:hypothetical protein
MRRGQLRSVTLTIPLLSERNTYLVVRLPNEIVQDAVRQARELPEAERPAFLRDWVMRNQQAVLEQYVRTGRSERRFRYDVVPVPTRMGEVTPRRVEPEQAHRMIQEYRQVSRTGQDIVPAGGWRRPREGELPQAIRERANQHHLGRIPLGDGVAEEYGGARYFYLKCWHPPDSRNPRRHHGISVFVADESVRAVTPPPQEIPSERPVRPATEQRQLPPFPSQIKGGNGSSQRPYEVFMSRAEVERDEPRAGATAVIRVPINVDIEGLGSLRFMVGFRARQVTRNRRQSTQTELWQIIRQTAERVAAERGVRVDNTAFRTAIASYNQSFPRIMDQIEQQDPDLRRYLAEN